MTPLIGTVLLFGICALMAGVFAWMILSKMASRQRLSGPVELLLEYLPEAKATTPRGLNWAIKAIIRRAAVPGPNGRRAMSLAVVRLRPEDLNMLRSVYGLDYYAAELGKYHRKVAARKRWEYGPDRAPIVVRFVEDPDRKPMRPALDESSSAAVLPNGTRIYSQASDRPTGEQRTVHQGKPREPLQPGNEGHTEEGARFVGPGIDRVLFPAEAPISIGRSHENTLVIKGETVHRQHARLDYTDGQWTLVPLKLTNSTMVNGARITSPAAISGVTKISFGDSGAFTFNVRS
jgi:hypothetical protein